MSSYIAPRRAPHGEWAYMSRQERDLAYNNTAAVQNAAQINAARAAASAQFRATRPSKLDIAYGSSERQKLDLFPSAEPTSPCLLYIHGGYWQRGAREMYSILAEGVRPLGWHAAFIGYDLTPHVTLTDIVAQINAGIDWLAQNGHDFNIAGPIIVAGHSAGGQLAALALSNPHVKAGLAISGVFELGPLRDTPLNDALKLSDEEVEAFSPLRLPVVNKPLGIAYGTAELPALLEDSRRLHARRANAHAPGPLIPVVNADHFTILDELQKPDGLLTRAVLDLAR
jgi:acetyl esterase/lipase